MERVVTTVYTLSDKLWQVCDWSMIYLFLKWHESHDRVAIWWFIHTWKEYHTVWLVLAPTVLGLMCEQKLICKLEKLSRPTVLKVAARWPGANRFYSNAGCGNRRQYRSRDCCESSGLLQSTYVWHLQARRIAQYANKRFPRKTPRQPLYWYIFCKSRWPSWYKTSM